MPATKGEKIGVFIISFLMILSVLGGSALYFMQDNLVEKEVKEKEEEEAQAVKDQAFYQECSKLTEEITNKKEDTPEVYKVDGEVEELEIKNLKEGNGKELQLGDCGVINYHGTLAQGGQVLDSSYISREKDKDAKPFAAIVKEGNLIDGWVEGIPGMKVGGERRLIIPADKAYGESGTTINPYTGTLLKDKVDEEKDINPSEVVDKDEDGFIDYIPEDSDLVFDIRLIDVLEYSKWEEGYTPEGS